MSADSLDQFGRPVGDLTAHVRRLTTEHPWSAPPAVTKADEPQMDLCHAVLEGLAGCDAVVCVTDENDDIHYATPSFCNAFFPQFDGRRTNFTTAIDAAIRAGTGIKLVSRSPDEFARVVRERRRRQTGSQSFAVDLMDGSWWWVTDVKLANGGMLCVGQNISSLKHEEFRLRDAHASAEKDAQTDILTGIANRRYGLKQAESLCEASRATARPFSIALLDIDRFKPINDLYGHETGDRALQHLSQSVAGAIRAADQFSRLGGDEFLLVMPDTALDVLDITLSAVLANVPPLRLDEPPGQLWLSVSVGAALFSSDETWTDVMRRADRALYAAKAAGRGRIARAA